MSRRDKLRAKLDRACAELERRAQARADSERAEYERKVAAREQRAGSRKGRHIKPPQEEPEAKEQINLTDADSSLMRKSKHHEYRQAYNAQAAVDADGSQLVLGARVSVCASDRNELVADMDAIPAALGAAERVLADNGYARAARYRNWKGAVWRYWWPPGRPAGAGGTTSGRSRRSTWRRSRRRTARRCGRWPGALPFAQADGGAGVRDREAGDGLRQFLLRGLEKVEGEWALVTLAYNCRRLHKLRLA